MYQRSAKINPNFSSKRPPPDLFPVPPVQIRDGLTPLELRIDRAISRSQFGRRDGNYGKAYEEMRGLVQKIVRERGFPSRTYQ